MLILKKVMQELPDVNFYWVGDGVYREKIIDELGVYENFHWLGHLQYPEKVREYLSEVDLYALVSGMDLAPLTLKEAQLMKKPVIAPVAWFVSLLVSLVCHIRLLEPTLIGFGSCLTTMLRNVGKRLRVYRRPLANRPYAPRPHTYIEGCLKKLFCKIHSKV